MITARGSWTLALATSGLLSGLLARHEAAAFICLAIILWIFLEWLRFAVSVLVAERGFEGCRRTIGDVGQVRHTLSIGQKYGVKMSLPTPSFLGGTRWWVEDVIPAGCAIVAGSAAHWLDPRPDRLASCDYAIRPDVTGRMVLPGVQVILTDHQGFFRRQRFVPCRQELTVLPTMVRPQATVSGLKRSNVQLLTGTHSYRRPGFSAELLGIRNYQPGDPPRTIAWKATARLGQLMTCEYESEVPIRATLITDLSPYQFAGRPGPAMVDRSLSVTASVARLLLADRDPVACSLVSDTSRTRLPHSYGERQLTRLLEMLMNVCNAQLDVDHLRIDALVDAVWTSGYRQFPELFEDSINRARPGISFISRGRRHLTGRRQQVAMVLAQLEGEPPGSAVRMQYDDALFRQACRRFWNQYPTPPVPQVGAGDFEVQRRARRQAVKTMCRALLEGTARAHDNELFVLVGSTPLDEASIEQLEESVRVTRARYHRVIMIDIGGPSSEDRSTDPLAGRILADSDRLATYDRYQQLARRLGGLGVKMAHLDDPQMVKKIAAEVELLKFGRTRGMVSRR